MASDDPRRSLPSVDALLRSPEGRDACTRYGRILFGHLVRDEIERARASIEDARRRSSGNPADATGIVEAASLRAADILRGSVRIINASGVLLHTGLGRAPLPSDAAAAAVRVAGASDLEIDLATGGRGRRTARAETMLAALTGAEAAVVVNNGAAALFLTLSTLAAQREVPTSRGELIEIGGEFRLPDIMRAAGAHLVEVGTTNRTRTSDYAAAITPETAALLKVHPSNYRVVGFTGAPTIAEVSGVATAAHLPLIFDAGSGMLTRFEGVPDDEPAVDEAVRAGADVVICSGDKLMGGPQAGIIVGRAELLEPMRRHPVARTMRVDKMRVAALDAVLARLCVGDPRGLPLRRMLATDEQELRQRADVLITALGSGTIVQHSAVVGGGSAPGEEIDSIGVRIDHAAPERLARALRSQDPAIVCLLETDAVLFDLRTVDPGDLDELATAVKAALVIPDDDGARWGS